MKRNVRIRVCFAVGMPMFLCGLLVVILMLLATLFPEEAGGPPPGRNLGSYVRVGGAFDGDCVPVAMGVPL